MASQQSQDDHASRHRMEQVDIASHIDHTLLTPTATPDQVEQWCTAAEQYRFASVCVNPCHVKQAAERLYRSRVLVSTVVGFPLGTSLTEVKLHEAQLAVEHGAQELDLKLNLTLLRAGQLDALHAEVGTIVESTGVPIKVILETALLTDEEKQTLGQLCIEAGAAFLKTSTGWTGGATEADVRLLWQLTQGGIPIKASGGIRTPMQAINLLQAGATRLGTSYGIEIVTSSGDPNPSEQADSELTEV